MGIRSGLEKVLLNPIVLLPVGAVLAIIGAIIVAYVPSMQSRLRDIEQLRPWDQAEPGQPAFVEGSVSNRTPLIYHQFVAHVREEYQSVGRSSTWVEVARETPPIVIETNGKMAHVVNNNYDMETMDIILEEQSPTFTQGAVRSRGFVAGSSVFAIGKLEGAGDLVAEFLYAGTRADYAEYLRRSLRGSIWWGGGLLLGGIVLISLGVWRTHRFLESSL